MPSQPENPTTPTPNCSPSPERPCVNVQPTMQCAPPLEITVPEMPRPTVTIREPDHRDVSGGWCACGEQITPAIVQHPSASRSVSNAVSAHRAEERSLRSTHSAIGYPDVTPGRSSKRVALARLYQRLEELEMLYYEADAQYAEAWRRHAAALRTNDVVAMRLARYRVRVAARSSRRARIRYLAVHLRIEAVRMETG